MTDIKQLAEVCDLVQTGGESQTATLAERVLTHEAQAERDCCGTFYRSPHRKTCEKYRGKSGQKNQSAEAGHEND